MNTLTKRALINLTAFVGSIAITVTLGLMVA